MLRYTYIACLFQNDLPQQHNLLLNTKHIRTVYAGWGPPTLWSSNSVVFILRPTMNSFIICNLLFFPHIRTIAAFNSLSHERHSLHYTSIPRRYYPVSAPHEFHYPAMPTADILSTFQRTFFVARRRYMRASFITYSRPDCKPKLVLQLHVY